MSHTQESKQNLLSKDLWFKKENYMSKFLNKKSKSIINKIKNKNMKNLIFTLLLLPSLAFSQSDYMEAIKFQNTLRSYYDFQPLSYNQELSINAQQWAEYLAETDDFVVSMDGYGENIFSVSKEYIRNKNKNVYLEASMNWILDVDEDYSTYNQILYDKASSIGFGISENNEYIYIVAKYDKLHE